MSSSTLTSLQVHLVKTCPMKRTEMRFTAPRLAMRSLKSVARAPPA